MPYIVTKYTVCSISSSGLFPLDMVDKLIGPQVHDKTMGVVKTNVTHDIK